LVLDDDGPHSPDFQEEAREGHRNVESSRNTGSHVFEPAIFDRIPADTFYDS